MPDSTIVILDDPVLRSTDAFAGARDATQPAERRQNAPLRSTQSQPSGQAAHFLCQEPFDRLQIVMPGGMPERVKPSTSPALERPEAKVHTQTFRALTTGGGPSPPGAPGTGSPRRECSAASGSA